MTVTTIYETYLDEIDLIMKLDKLLACEKDWNGLNGKVNLYII